MYIPDESGINSLGGFAYQIKVFVSYMLSMEEELIIMNKMHMVQDQPCDYMLDKLDEFLMSLEK